MKISRFVGAAALALLLFVTLVVSAPARLLHFFVPDEMVVLRGLTGTVWDGAASGVLVHLPQGYFHLGAVHWSLRPLSLLTLAPHLTVRSEWGRQTLDAEVIVHSAQDIDVFNLEAQLAANVLRRFAPVVVEGLFSLQAELLQVRDGMPNGGEGRLVWQNAGWNSPRGLVPLGTYALDFQQPENEALQGQVLTLSGPLQASGTLQLQQRHYEVDVLLHSEVELDAQVQQMLSLIAQPEDAGYRLNLAGDL